MVPVMNEAQQKGWKEFGVRMQKLVADGSTASAFVFIRVDILPNEGLVTNAIHYQIGQDTRLALIAHQLQSLHTSIHEGSSNDYKYKISRVCNLFNKMFNAHADVTNKKDLN